MNVSEPSTERVLCGSSGVVVQLVGKSTAVPNSNIGTDTRAIDSRITSTHNGISAFQRRPRARAGHFPSKLKVVRQLFWTAKRLLGGANMRCMVRITVFMTATKSRDQRSHAAGIFFPVSPPTWCRSWSSACPNTKRRRCLGIRNR